MTDRSDRKHLRDVAPGVEEDLGLPRDADKLPTPEEEQAADDLSPDQKVALNYRRAIKRGPS
jgi:hypothetical protein